LYVAMTTLTSGRLTELIPITNNSITQCNNQ
jgi:hypothetical protein